ncbi:hypothetical protein NKJ84_04180 [Mesorhizobium sp. M0048]|uniref:hypothetical protein n=1 Tax=Mesorhizobium sp. M0048 TaxID=2956860 RepID=UPI00333DB78F
MALLALLEGRALGVGPRLLFIGFGLVLGHLLRLLAFRQRAADGKRRADKS